MSYEGNFESLYENFGEIAGTYRKKESKMVKVGKILALVILLLFFTILFLKLTPHKTTNKEVSAIFINQKTIQDVQPTLNSFFEMNTYPLQKIIVAVDMEPSEKVYENLKEKYKQYNIKWIANDKKQKMGLIALLDLAYAEVQSVYVFVSFTNQIYFKKSFIELSVEILQKYSNVSQVILKGLQGSISESFTSLETILAGFTFRAGLHRFRNYEKLQGGYTGLTRNLTYGKNPARVQELISVFYYENGQGIRSLNESYIRYINNDLNTPIKFYFNKEILLEKLSNQDPNICWLANRLNRANRALHSKKIQIRKQLSSVITQNKYPADQKQRLQSLGLLQSIQLESDFDFMNLTDTKIFENLTYYFPKTFYHQGKKYDDIKKIQVPKVIQQKHFKDAQQAQNHILNTKMLNQQPQQYKTNLNYKLAANLYQNPNDQKLLQAEYKYYNLKYNFDKIEKQLPICVFLEGFNGVTSGNLSRLFTSVEGQNYSNYQFVYVDDFSRDDSEKKIYDILFSSHSTLLYRTKQIVMNQDILQSAGNHYLRAKAFCDDSDIVISLNLNSTLIGKQFFKVINAIYQDQSVWVALFPSLKKLINQENIEKIVRSQELNLNEYLRVADLQIDSYLKTFRYPLIQKLPLQYVIEYAYSLDIQGFPLGYTPRFYQSSSDKFWIYSYLELSGKKAKVYEDIFLFYNAHHIVKPCYEERQAYQAIKSQLKRPLKPIKSFNDKVKFNKDYKIPFYIQNNLSNAFKKLNKCLESKNQIVQVIEPKRFTQFLENATQRLVFPNRYITPMPATYDQLPFCIIIRNDERNKQDLITELKQNQNYSNLVIIVMKDQPYQQKTVDEKTGIIYITTKDHTHQNYLKIIQENIVQYPIVLFLNHPLKPKALNYLNDIYQTQNVWMTYSEAKNYFMVHSFYLRVYELMNLTDFEGTNKQLLKENDPQFQTLAMLQICAKKSMKLEPEQIYSEKYVSYEQKLLASSETGFSFTQLTAYKYNTHMLQRKPYSYILQLNHGIPLNVTQLQQNIKKLHKSREEGFKSYPNSLTTRQDMLRSIQYHQLLYLPKNHSLHKREYEELDAKYNIGKYMKNQHRFCLLVSGRNNTQNNRHFKNLKSIFSQQYDNFHVVYIDDVSDDATLEEAIQFAKKEKFPKEKITFIKNIVRGHATFNMINTAFNHCGQDDIQVKLSADDQFLGRYVFGLLNSIYNQHPQYWLVYTNSMTNIYNYGLSMKAITRGDYLNCDGTRRMVHFISHLRSWRVKLIRSIPMKYHQLEYGGWLDTLQDDALQASFLELATLNHIGYAPWINYYRNVHYGSNNDSDRSKVFYRINVFEYVLSLPMLQPLKYIDQRYKNPELAAVLHDKIGKWFKVIDF